MARVAITLGVPEEVHNLDALRDRDRGEAGLCEALESLLAGCREDSIEIAGEAVGDSEISAQRRAELLIDAARAWQGQGPLEEVRFVVDGEVPYRLFEAVHDAARIAEQMKRLSP